jgi:hypothetical protein
MTNYVSQYNFMDLLKDNGVVPHIGPQLKEDTISLVALFTGLVEQFTSKIELTHEAHDFMDLMFDKGLIPANDNFLIADAA